MGILDTLVEVRLRSQEDFLKIKETLTRIGVADGSTKTLYQSCYILHKRGRYYITHFKELMALDGQDAPMEGDDIGRRNTIVGLLADWNLVDVVEPTVITERAPISMVKVLPFREKSGWQLVPKYVIGRRINR